MLGTRNHTCWCSCCFVWIQIVRAERSWGHDLVPALEVRATYMPSSVRALDTFEDASVSKHGAKAALVLLLPSILDQGICLQFMAYRRGLISCTVWHCHIDHCRGGMRRRGTEVDTKSPGTAKTLRIMLYIQNWGRLPRIGLGLVPGILVSTSVDTKKCCGGMQIFVRSSN